MNGLQHFWGSTDSVGHAVALLLLAMSVAAWVVILWKAWVLRRALGDIARAVRFLAGRKNGMFDMFDVLGLR